MEQYDRPTRKQSLHNRHNKQHLTNFASSWRIALRLYQSYTGNSFWVSPFSFQSQEILMHLQNEAKQSCDTMKFNIWPLPIRINNMKIHPWCLYSLRLRGRITAQTLTLDLISSHITITVLQLPLYSSIKVNNVKVNVHM